MESELCAQYLSLERLFRLSKLPVEQPKKRSFSDPRPCVIVISGPTAVGKTDLSLYLARLLGAEIISADSMQVYLGMDIGTAKPTKEQRSQILHHMIDMRPLAEPMNVAQYYDEAMQALRSVVARGKVPIVVGGSGFYLSALINGAPSGPPADPFIRAHLESEMEKLGHEHLYHCLNQLDPKYAASITRADRHKIIRALEIIILTQSKVSDQKRHSKTASSDFRFLCYFLYRPRESIYERINERCDAMIQQGLIQEVHRIIDYGLLENSSAANAIGYRQTLDFLKTPQSAVDYEHYKLQFKQASRHYAKRQFTWFRKEPGFEWLDMTQQRVGVIAEQIARDYLLG